MMPKTGPDPVDIHIGSRIRMRRLQLGITQQEIAGRLTMSFQQVQKYENGTNRVSGSRMAKIAEMLGVDPGFFFANLPGGNILQPHPLVDSTMDRFMASREGLMIAQAFVLIRNPQVRAAIAGFVKRMGDVEWPDVAPGIQP